jgi:GTP-binding protein Era
MRAGTVALVGRTNVGKSTLLNAALEHPLAIVSRKPQTTRDRLLGIVRHAGAEIGLLDTPGLHRPETGLGHSMNRTARAALREADLPILVTALPLRPREEVHPHREDLRLLGDLPTDRPAILVINKIDLLRDKRLLLPLIQQFVNARPFDAVVPISALRSDGIIRVLDEAARLLPLGAARHPEDALTDRPLRFFAAEYVREPILEATRQEIPYSVAVAIDEFTEPPDDGPIHVAATIIAERAGQKRILVGKGGEMLRRIGTKARRRLEALTGRRVVLKLWVRVEPQWRDRPDKLGALGYDSAPHHRRTRQAPANRRPRRGKTSGGGKRQP